MFVTIMAETAASRNCAWEEKRLSVREGVCYGIGVMLRCAIP